MAANWRNCFSLLGSLLVGSCGPMAQGTSPPKPRPPRAGVLCPGGPVSPTTPTDPASFPPGNRHPRHIQTILRAEYGKFRSCYEEALWRVPTARGRVQFRFVISSDGSVESACIQQPALRDGEALECVLDEVMTLTFGPGKRTTVVYPVQLEPGP